jgi:hypothetical protein
MGKLKVHGGDFARRPGSFDPATGFFVWNKNGKREVIPVEDLAVLREATNDSIRALGGDEDLVGELERIPLSERADRRRIVIVGFDDGRLLLASAGSRSYMELCSMLRPRARAPRS